MNNRKNPPRRVGYGNLRLASFEEIRDYYEDKWEEEREKINQTYCNLPPPPPSPPPLPKVVSTWKSRRELGFPRD
tara:strand:- start:143 stop:367 length:225 start_codon:yes stop_codon:yes gene_type:complete